MIGTVHLLTGAMIGVLLNDPVAVVPAAFFSHYFLDFLPHVDSDTFADSTGPYSWRQLTALVLDTASMILFAYLFLSYQTRWKFILLGGLVAILPDLMVPLEKYDWFAPMRLFHEMWHWKKERAQQWKWYIAGLCSQVAIGVIALFVLRR